MHEWLQKMFIDEVKPALERYGSGNGDVKCETGTYTPTADVRVAVSIPHNLGVTPTVMLAFAEDKDALVGVTGYMLSYAAFNFSLEKDCHHIVGTSNPSVGGGYKARSELVSDTEFRIAATPTYKLKAGVTYRWVILAL